MAASWYGRKVITVEGGVGLVPDTGNEMGAFDHSFDGPAAAEAVVYRRRGETEELSDLELARKRRHL